MRNGAGIELVAWQNIPGYEGYFTISAQGDIRARSKVVKSPKGYVLYKGGLQHRARFVELDREARGLELLHAKTPINNRLTAELILLAFRGPRLNNQFKLKYRDGDQENFNLDNLVWTVPRLKLAEAPKVQLAIDIELQRFESTYVDWILELLGPEPKPPQEPEPERVLILIEEPIDGWINRYQAWFPVPDDIPEPIEWPEPLTNWEELYISLVDEYDTNILKQNDRILKLRSRVQRLRQRLQEFYEEMQQLEDEFNYQLELMEQGFRYQVQQLEGEFNYQMHHIDAELRARILQLEGEFNHQVHHTNTELRTRMQQLEGEFDFQIHYIDAGVRYQVQKQAEDELALRSQIRELEEQIIILKTPPKTPRLKLTDTAAKSLTKIPREKLTKISRERFTPKISRERLTHGILRERSVQSG